MKWKYAVGQQMLFYKTTYDSYKKFINMEGIILKCNIEYDEHDNKVPGYTIKLFGCRKEIAAIEDELVYITNNYIITPLIKITNKVYIIRMNKKNYYCLFDNYENIKLNKSLDISGYINNNKIYVQKLINRGPNEKIH